MSCHRHEPSLFLLAHGQLTGIQRWYLESHLRRCPACREQWAQWVVEKDRLRRAFSPMPVQAAQPGDLMVSVGARIRGEARPQLLDKPEPVPYTPRRWAVLAVAAATLALAVAAMASYLAPKFMSPSCPPTQQINPAVAPLPPPAKLKPANAVAPHTDSPTPSNSASCAGNKP